LAVAGATRAQTDSFVELLAAEDECGSTSVRSSGEESLISKSIKIFTDKEYGTHDKLTV